MIARVVSHVRQQFLGALALFIALGGTSYAVATNSIGSPQIKDNSILSKDIRDNAVSTKDIKNSSLLAADFKPGQLPAGPAGPAGPTGARGSDGTPGAPGATGPKGDSPAPASATFTTHDPTDFYVTGDPYTRTQVIATGDHTSGDTYTTGDTGGPLIHLSAPGRVLATASLEFYSSSNSTVDASCYLGIAPNGSPTPQFFGHDTFLRMVPLETDGEMSLSAGIDKPAGDYYVNVSCHGSSANVAIFRVGTLIVWSLPA
jgi:hypothetical protein